jgi:hypothetical protein
LKLIFRSLESLNEYFDEAGIDKSKIWEDIENVINKTLIAVEFKVNSKIKQINCNPK